MAGIWERPEFDDEPATFAILTTKANELVAEVHDRMPVILPIGYEHRWVHGDWLWGAPQYAAHLPCRRDALLSRHAAHEQGIVQ